VKSEFDAFDETMGKLLSVPVFFGLRVAIAVGLLKLSASFLPVSGFAVFVECHYAGGGATVRGRR